MSRNANGTFAKGNTFGKVDQLEVEINLLCLCCVS